MERRNKRYVWPQFFATERFAIVGYVVAILGVIFCLVHFNVKPAAVPDVKPKPSVVEVRYDKLKEAMKGIDSCKFEGKKEITGSVSVITNIMSGVEPDTTLMVVTPTSITFNRSGKYIKMPAQMLTNIIDYQYINCVINK